MTVLRPRQRLGKYRIVRRLGDGGFANVYEDRELEVTAELDISVERQLARIAEEMRRRGCAPLPKSA